MGDAAVNAAKSIGYVGVGTIEFLWEKKGFYFMEMNTRIQARAPLPLPPVWWEHLGACTCRCPLWGASMQRLAPAAAWMLAA